MAAKRERDIYAAGHQRRVSNQNVANKNRKSTDTSANSGKTINRPAQTAKPVQQKKTVYYRSKDDARPMYKNPAKQKTVSRPRYTGKGWTTPKLSGWYAQPKQAAQPKAKAGDEGIYVRPPYWTWADDVKQLAKDRRVNQIGSYTNDYRVLDENPLKQLEASAPEGRRAYREEFGYKKTPHTVIGKIQERAGQAVDREKRLKQWIEERAPFRDWVDSHTYDYTEDKGTTLAQVNRLASLYGALYPTTKGYTTEQAKALQEEIRNAPIGLQELYIKYGNSLSPIVNMGNDGAFFSPAVGRVFGDPKRIAEDTPVNEPYGTHFHEFAHNLDWLSNEYNGLSNYSSTYRKDGKTFDDIIAEDWDHTLRDYWDTFKADKGPYNAEDALQDFSRDMMYAYPRSEMRDVAPLSDILSPYSAERTGDTHPIGYGHSAKYWRNHPESATAEAFADLSEASVNGGNRLRYIQAFMPNTYTAYLDMLKQMANNSYKMKTPKK